MRPHRSRAGFTLIELMIVIVILGLLAAIAIPNYINFQDQAKSARVKHNCHTVQLVAEDFSVRNDGTYPSSTADTTPDGRSIVDLLPGGQRLENPWSGARSEPVDGQAAATGQTGYRPVVQGGATVGYIVDGYGRNSLVLTVQSG